MEMDGAVEGHAPWRAGLGFADVRKIEFGGLETEGMPTQGGEHASRHTYPGTTFIKPSEYIHLPVPDIFRLARVPRANRAVHSTSLNHSDDLNNATAAAEHTRVPLWMCTHP